MKTAIKGQKKNQSRTLRQGVGRGDHPVKVSAYQFIIEAVAQENYEEVPEMIKIAQEFGARRWDIHKVLEQGVIEQRRKAITGGKK